MSRLDVCSSDVYRVTNCCLNLIAGNISVGTADDDVSVFRPQQLSKTWNGFSMFSSGITKKQVYHQRVSLYFIIAVTLGTQINQDCILAVVKLSTER